MAREFHQSSAVVKDVVTCTVTVPDTVEPLTGDVITSSPEVTVAVGFGVRIAVGVAGCAVGVALIVTLGVRVGDDVPRGVGVGVTVPFLTIIETEAVAVTVAVEYWCAVTVRVWLPSETVAEFHKIF